MKKIAVLCSVIMGFSVYVKAEDCLTVQSERLMKKPQIMPMQGVPTHMLSPAVRKMLEEQNKPAKPVEETKYWTPSSVITVTNDEVNAMSMDTMTVTIVDHKRKTYRSFSLLKMFEGLNMKKSGTAKSAAQGTAIKATRSAPKATGQKLKIAGIDCTEYQVRIDNNGQDVYKAMMPKSKGPGVKTYSLDTRCVNTLQPEAYFRIKKSHEQKFIKAMPPELQARMQEIAAGNAAGKSTEMLKGIMAMTGSTATDFDRGFDLRTIVEMKSEVDSQDPRMKAAMDKSSSGSTTTVKSISNKCPDASLLKVPAGYKEEKSPFGA